MFAVRPENPRDYAAVRDVNERAFGRSAEADLVETLRRTAAPYLSLVAEEENLVVGHIFFSPVEVRSEGGRFRAMGLAPMAVLPGHQRQGVGSTLVREGLRACKQMGSETVVVLGHPEYYPRFGFKPAQAYGLRSEYDVPAEVFMAVELSPGALDTVNGTVRYHAAFNELE